MLHIKIEKSYVILFIMVDVTALVLRSVSKDIQELNLLRLKCNFSQFVSYLLLSPCSVLLCT